MDLRVNAHMTHVQVAGLRSSLAAAQAQASQAATALEAATRNAVTAQVRLTGHRFHARKLHKMTCALMEQPGKHTEIPGLENPGCRQWHAMVVLLSQHVLG